MHKGIKTAMINVFVAAGVFYVAVVISMYVFQRNFMYFPDNSKPSRIASGVPDMAEITFATADGLELFAWHGQPVHADKPTVVMFHGNAGTIGDRGYKARTFLDGGYGVLLVEYRGFSGNPGSPSEDGLYQDARGALGYLSNLGVEKDDIVIYGESLGTGVAITMAAEAQAQGAPVAAVILEAPYTSTVDAGAAHYPFLPVRWLMKDRFESIKRIDDIDAPLFVVHGEQDWTVPAKLGKRLFAAAQEPKDALWIPQAGHNDVYDFGAGQAVLNFLKRHAVSGK